VKRVLNWQKFFASFFQKRRSFFSEEKKQKIFARWPASAFVPDVKLLGCGDRT
jgi:hypothetical protein